jgi:hypothetical protein
MEVASATMRTRHMHTPTDAGGRQVNQGPRYVPATGRLR